MMRKACLEFCIFLCPLIIFGSCFTVNFQPIEEYSFSGGRYSQELSYCFRQINQTMGYTAAGWEHMNDERDRSHPYFNISYEEKCSFYQAICPRHDDAGCCALDRPNMDYYLKNFCVEDEPCYYKQCFSLHRALNQCTKPSSHFSHPCHSDNINSRVRRCKEFCTQKSVRFVPEAECKRPTSVDEMLPPCLSASTVALKGSTVVRQCEVSLISEEKFLSERKLNITQVSYKWSVLKGDKPLNASDRIETHERHGVISVVIHNVTGEDSESLYCLVERHISPDLTRSLPSDIPSEFSKDIKHNRDIDGVSFQRLPAIQVIDPLDNFALEAVKSVDFNLVPVNDERSRYNFSCSLQYNDLSVWRPFSRYVFLAILMFPNWTEHSFSERGSFELNSTGLNGLPDPVWIDEKLHFLMKSLEPLEEELNTYDNDTVHYAMPTSHEDKLLELTVSAPLNVKLEEGGIVVCLLQTAAVQLSSSKIISRTSSANLSTSSDLIWIYVAVTLVVSIVICVVIVPIAFNNYRVKVYLLTNTEYESSDVMMTDVSRAGSPSHAHLDSTQLLMDSSFDSPASESDQLTNLTTDMSDCQSSSTLTTLIDFGDPDDFDYDYDGSETHSQVGEGLSYRDRMISVYCSGTNHEATSTSTSTSILRDDNIYGGIEVRIPRLKDPYSVILSSRKYKVVEFAELKPYRIPSRRLHILNEIGSGNFGKVMKAELLSTNGSKSELAVKVLQDNATFGNLKEFIVEAVCMARAGEHDNIVSLKGLCFDGEPRLAMELCPRGDLGNLLRKLRLRIDDDCLTADDDFIVHLFFHKWSTDIAAGVTFLHSKKILHRDLATRNVLVTENFGCKLSDFGLARDMGDSGYYPIRNSRSMPYRWLAPEIFADQRCTAASDVWALAVTIWEIFYFGARPYTDLSNDMVNRYVTSGGRLPVPSSIEIKLQRVLKRCWLAPASCRPSAAQVWNSFKDHVYFFDNSSGDADERLRALLI